MSAYQFGPVEVSRSTALMMIRAGQVERQEQREREAAAEARREEGEALLRAYITEHGETPAETVHRQALLQAQREQALEARRAQERLEQQQAYTAELLAAGRKPRSIEEILEIYRLVP